MRRILLVTLFLTGLLSLFPLPIKADPLTGLSAGDIEVVRGKYYMTTSVGDYVILGDTASPEGEFLPSVELRRWGAECNVKLELGLTGGTVTYNSATKVITWNSAAKDQKAISFYYKPETDTVEFDIILKVKPLSKVQSLGFTSNNLVFYYQPPLTEEYETEWKEFYPNKGELTITETDIIRNKDRAVLVHRPIDIVGSYVAYHATQQGYLKTKAAGDKFQTGIALQWKRPFIWDSSPVRKETWGVLRVDTRTNQRTVTIPQAFLDSAVYPVTIDDTFGYTTAGSSSFHMTSSGLYGQHGIPADGNGAVDDIKAYTTCNGNNIKAVLVEETGLTIVSNGVGGIYDDSSYYDTNWHTMSYTNKPSVVNGASYCPSIIPNYAYQHLYYNTGSGDQALIDTTNSYTTPTNPTDGTRSTTLYSLYADYTASAGGNYLPRMWWFN